MLNLLIVDDEELDREGLLAELDWEQYGISEVRAARTGAEALEIMKGYEPHILMTDIKMPVMNGLQLAEKAKKLFPNIKVVFISGYDSFEYAQYAIKLNVCGYLLKPVDTDELAQVIINVVDDIVKERSSMEQSDWLQRNVDESRPFLKTRLFSSMFFGTYEDEGELVNRAQYLGLSFVTGKYLLLLAQIDDYIQWVNNMTREENERICLDICNLANEMGNCVYHVEAVFIDLQTIAILISCDEHVPDELAFTDIIGIAEHIIGSVMDMFGISISMGISRVLHQLSEIQQGYNECCDALKNKLYTGKGKVNRKPQENQTQKFKLSFENVDVELSKLLIAGDRARIAKTIDHMFEMIENFRVSDNQLVQNLCINIISRLNITVLEMGMDLNDIFGGGALLLNKLMSFETILDIRMWMKNIFSSVLEYHENMQGSKHTSLRRDFQKYIEEHYQQDITLKELAEEWHYSPNYLGNIFKQEFGKGFSEYLAEYRMKKAALLLKNHETKIYEVAHQVGYNNISSFIKQFKQAYEVTPAEYRTSRDGA